jgi:hypothetical protein
MFLSKRGRAMSYITINPNPHKKRTGDCTIRALCVAENKDWDDIFFEIMLKCFIMKELPEQNNVWVSYLHDIGYERYLIPNTCPDCYTIKEFAKDHPKGTFVLATGSHVVTVKDGEYYDTWDSGDEIPIYYWEKENKND